MDGDPLEYTGTGMEMFKGFVMALFTVFLPLGIVLNWASTAAQSGNVFAVIVTLGVYLVFLWLLGLARPSSHKNTR